MSTGSVKSKSSKASSNFENKNLKDTISEVDSFEDSVATSNKVPDQDHNICHPNYSGKNSEKDLNTSGTLPNTPYKNNMMKNSGKITREPCSGVGSKRKNNDNQVLEQVSNFMGISASQRSTVAHTSTYVRTTTRKNVTRNVLGQIDEENCHGHASRVCMMEPDQRKPTDIDVLVKATSFLTFFKNMNKKKAYIEFNCHQKCCKYLQTKVIKQGEIVITFGATPDNFYIILRGSVGIYIPRPFDKKDLDESVMNLLVKLAKNSTIAQNQFMKYATPENGFSEDMIAVAQNIASIKENYIIYTDDYLSKLLGSELPYDKLHCVSKIFDEKTGIAKFNWVAMLGKGQIFGDRGQLEKGLRAASCICTIDTELMYMTKDDYGKVLGEVAKCQSDIKKKYFCHNVFKNYFNIETAGHIGSYFYEKLKLNRGNVIYKQDDKADSIFYIKYGQVKITQNKTELPVFELPKNRNSSELSKKIKNSRTIDLALLGDGEIFGEEEILKGGKRMCNAYATTNTKIFIMSKSNFLSLLKEYSEFYIWVKDRLFLKDRSRNKICEKSSSTAIKYLNKKTSDKLWENGMSETEQSPNINSNNILRQYGKFHSINCGQDNSNDNCDLQNEKKLKKQIKVDTKKTTEIETEFFVQKYKNDRYDAGALDIDELIKNVKKKLHTGNVQSLSTLKQFSKPGDTFADIFIPKNLYLLFLTLIFKIFIKKNNIFLSKYKLFSIENVT